MANNLKRYQQGLASSLNRTSPSYYTRLDRTWCISAAEIGRSSFGLRWDEVTDAFIALFQDGNPLSLLSWIMMKLMRTGQGCEVENRLVFKWLSLAKCSPLTLRLSSLFVSLCMSWCGNWFFFLYVNISFCLSFMYAHLSPFCHGSLDLHPG